MGTTFLKANLVPDTLGCLGTEVQRKTSSPLSCSVCVTEYVKLEKGTREECSVWELGEDPTHPGAMLRMKWLGLLPKISQHFKQYNRKDTEIASLGGHCVPGKAAPPAGLSPVGHVGS